MSRPPVLLNVARPWGEDDAVALATRALAAGLDGVGLADSPRLFSDPLVETGRVLSETDARMAGPCVLGLGLRHPATVGGAVRTLAAHHPGRVVAVVGRGESSVRNEGLPVPSLREHEAAMRALRELVADSAGSTLLGAASGPRTIAATADALGGVLVDVGTDHGVVARAAAIARDADPGAAVWVFLRAAVTSSVEEADAAARPVLGSCAARITGAPDFYGVDGNDLDHVRDVAAAHDYRRHGTADARRPGHVAGPGDALVGERFLVTGDGPTVTARIHALTDVGVDGVVLAGAVAGVTERLADLAAAVIRGLSTPEAAR